MARARLIDDPGHPTIAFVAVAHPRLNDRGVRHIVENAAVEVAEVRVVSPFRTLEALAERHHQSPVEGDDRPLGAGVELTKRLDQITHELHARRVALTGREEVDNPSPHTELAVRIDRVLRREPGVGQEIPELGRRQLSPQHQLLRGLEQPLRSRQTREQRGRGGNDQPRGSLGQPAQCSGARGRHIEVRRDRSIRIDLGRRKGKHRSSRRRLSDSPWSAA